MSAKERLKQELEGALFESLNDNNWQRIKDTASADAGTDSIRIDCASVGHMGKILVALGCTLGEPEVMDIARDRSFVPEEFQLHYNNEILQNIINTLASAGIKISAHNNLIKRSPQTNESIPLDPLERLAALPAKLAESRGDNFSIYVTPTPEQARKLLVLQAKKQDQIDQISAQLQPDEIKDIKRYITEMKKFLDPKDPEDAEVVKQDVVYDIYRVAFDGLDKRRLFTKPSARVTGAEHLDALHAQITPNLVDYLREQVDRVVQAELGKTNTPALETEVTELIVNRINQELEEKTAKKMRER